MSTQMLPREVLSEPGGGCMTCRIGGGPRDMSCEARALTAKVRGGVCVGRALSCDVRDVNCDRDCEIEGSCDGKRGSFDGRGGSCDGKRGSCDGRGGSCDGQRSSFDGKKGSFDGKRASCDGRGGSYEGNNGSCDGRRISFEGIRGSCDGRGSICDGKVIECEIRSMPCCENNRVSYTGRVLPGGQHTQRGGRIYRSWRGRGFSNRQRQRQPRLASQHLSAETRAAKSLAIIVMLFVISWIPLYVMNTVVCLWPGVHIPEALIKFGIVLSHFNSAWNPALYAWGMRDFKHCLRKLLGQFHKPRTLVAML